jgi:parallel beta-helix repeat protein
MKKRTFNTAKSLFILSLFMFLFTSYAHGAGAGFYVIVGAGGKPVGTEITSLPYTISSSGFYYIAKDLTCPPNSHGITIAADNVTLDLMGFSLNGPGSGDPMNGIHMDGRSNVEIRNGTVRNFSKTGIYDSSTSAVGHRITNIRVNDNGSSGIRLIGTGHTVIGCTAVINGGSGITAGTGSTVTGNICNSNSTTGIIVGTGSTVTGNTCFGNDHGIIAESGSTITNNTSSYNVFGIEVTSDCFVDQNTAFGNGFNMSSCATCTFGTNHAPYAEERNSR